MTKEELASLRNAMEATARTVENMGLADTTRWSVEQRVEMDLEYARAKHGAETARQAYYGALAQYAAAPEPKRALH